MFSSGDFSFAQQQHFMLQQVMRFEELENAKGANVVRNTRKGWESKVLKIPGW